MLEDQTLIYAEPNPDVTTRGNYYPDKSMATAAVRAFSLQSHDLG